jgi:transcription termination factor Rho
LYVIILCRKYEEENQIWMQHQPQKRRRHNFIGSDSFPKFEEWIFNAINDAKEEGQYITTEESELSQSPHIWAIRFSGMWAYGSHLRVEEKDKGKTNCDCVVSAEFLHEIEKKFYVGFIQEIIQVDFGENSPILLKCKWIRPSAVQFDEYGFIRANTRQFLSETDEPYVSPLQINQSFLIDDVRSPGWSYVIQTESRSR